MIPNFFATSHCFTDDSTYHGRHRGKDKALGKDRGAIDIYSWIGATEPWGVWEVQLLDGKTQSHPAPKAPDLGDSVKK